MRRLLAALVLLLSAPAWVVGLVLVPLYFVERIAYSCARRALLDFLAAMRGTPVPGRPLSSRDRYFARARNARRARKVVRS